MFLAGTVHSRSTCTSPYKGISIGTCAGGCPVVAQHPIQGWGSRNTPVHLILLKQEPLVPPSSNWAEMQTFWKTA